MYMSMFLLQAFSFQLTVTSFVDILLKKQWEKRALAVMQQLCQFYIVNGIIGFSGSFIQVRCFDLLPNLSLVGCVRSVVGKIYIKMI